jgi:hypothetical protein
LIEKKISVKNQFNGTLANKGFQQEKIILKQDATG